MRGHGMTTSARNLGSASLCLSKLQLRQLRNVHRNFLLSIGTVAAQE